jgi:hypothetical protein
MEETWETDRQDGCHYNEHIVCQIRDIYITMGIEKKFENIKFLLCYTL